MRRIHFILQFIWFAVALAEETTEKPVCTSALPTLPPYFSTTLQYNMKNQAKRHLLSYCSRPGSNCKKLPKVDLPIGELGKSISIFETVDDRLKLASVNTFKEFNINEGNETFPILLFDRLVWNDALTGVDDFINEIVIGFPYGEKFCLADNVHESSSLDWLFGFNPSCGGNHTENNCGTPSVTGMLHSAGCWNITNSSLVIRGVDVIEYSTSWHIDAWQADLDVRYYWTDPTKWISESGTSHSIPVAAHISGTAYNSENIPVDIEDFIEYQDFFQIEPNPFEFYPPSDMYCEGRELLDTLPKNFPEFYTFTSENVWHWQFPGVPLEQTIVTKKHEWYDYGLNLSRVDAKPIDWSHPQNPFEGKQHIIRDIQDFNAGISYQIDTVLGNCSVLPLTEDTVGNGDIWLDENGKLHMRDPLHFFHMDKHFAYNGETMDRGILMDVFVTTHPIKGISDDKPETNYTMVVYLTSSIYENDGMPGKRLIPAKIVGYPSDKYNDKRQWTITNVFDVQEAVPDMTNFDVTPCFDKDHSARLAISMSYDNAMDISTAYREFKATSTLSLFAAGSVAPIRIQHLQAIVYPDRGYYDLMFTITDTPPFNMTGTGLSEYYTNSIETIKNNLKREVDRRNFVIKIVNFHNGQNITFINSVGQPGTFRVVDFDSQQGNTIGFQNPDSFSEIGYTSGAMAGLAFGMIFLGALVAATVYFFAFRNNVRAGLPVMRGIDNPLHGLSDLKNPFKK